VISHVLGNQGGITVVRAQKIRQAIGRAARDSGGGCDDPITLSNSQWRTQRAVLVNENVRLDAEDTCQKRIRNECIVAGNCRVEVFEVFWEGIIVSWRKIEVLIEVAAIRTHDSVIMLVYKMSVEVWMLNQTGVADFAYNL
jgi:hypothetical protein